MTASESHGTSVVKLRSPSALALIVANIVPLAGVPWFGWEFKEILILYWAECGIIGVFNLLKMAAIGPWWEAVGYGLFFIMHYGWFMAGALAFIYITYIGGYGNETFLPLDQLAADLSILWFALLALFLSHGVSFLLNFIGRREYEGREARKQMIEPYIRIALMFSMILFGSILVSGEPTLPALALMIAFKVGADLFEHLRDRIAAAKHRALVLR